MLTISVSGETGKADEMPGIGSQEESCGVRLAIFGCFALTCLMAVIVSETPLGEEVRQLIDRADEGSEQSTNLAVTLAQDLLEMPPAGREERAAEIVREQPPVILMELFQELTKTPEARALAVRIVEMGAERYQEVTIKVRVAREYSVGRFVEKDYPKAIRLYADPVIRDLPGVKYYLGEIYLAQDNPGRDEERGLRLLREAATQGVALAIARLEKLDEDAAK